MNLSKNPPRKKPGRKGKKVRSHLALSDTLNAAVEFMGQHTFGSKTAYIEHLIMKDLERQNLTVPDILQLIADWRKENSYRDITHE